MSGFQFLSGLLFLVEFLEFLLCSEISCFGFPKLFGIFRVALLFICQGACLCLFALFRTFIVVLLFSPTTFIGYHIFAILSTTFFNFFQQLFLSFPPYLTWQNFQGGFYHTITLFSCQHVFSFFFCQKKHIRFNIHSSQFPKKEKCGSQHLCPFPLTAKTEKEGFEPSRRLPDLHP